MDLLGGDDLFGGDDQEEDLFSMETPSPVKK